MSNMKSRTSLVLMELIITILFFSICSAVCVQLFVNAHLITKDTKELNNAISIAQSFSEVLRGTNGDFNEIANLYPDGIVFEDLDYFHVYYDEDFNPTNDINTASYVADVSLSYDGRLCLMETVVVRIEDVKEIYSLTSSKYIRNSRVHK